MQKKAKTAVRAATEKRMIDPTEPEPFLWAMAKIRPVTITRSSSAKKIGRNVIGAVLLLRMVISIIKKTRKKRML